LETLLLGVTFGFAAGITPGPLTTLTAATALQRGFAAGVRVAIAPLLTDVPVIVISLLAVGSVPDRLFRLPGILGGAFVLYLGVDMLRSGRSGRLEADLGSRRRDVTRGFFTNLLSPYPWLFWLGVGAPILIRGAEQGAATAVGFLAGFYVLLVGSKVVIAWAAAQGGERLAGPWYRRSVILAGVLLMAFGGLLIWEAATGRL
jgi:threonine/homoserine/homoserine lactone efflux protein